LEVFRLTYDTESEMNYHTVESLPKEIGQQAVSTISNLIESNGFDEKNEAEKIIKTIHGIGKLSLVDKPVGSKIEFNSSQINFVQSREYFSDIIGKNFENDESAITIPNGIFDNLDQEKIESFSFIDVRLIQWNKNPHSYAESSSNISSPVISVDLFDESGKELKIENLTTPIQIKILSKQAKNGTTECRFFNTTSNQWNMIEIKKIEDGEYTICVTNHLSDFATFIANEESNPMQSSPGGFNTQWLLLLLLIIPGVGVIGTVTALIIIIIKKKKDSKGKTPLIQSSNIDLTDISTKENVEINSSKIDENNNRMNMIKENELQEIHIEVLNKTETNQLIQNQNGNEKTVHPLNVELSDRTSKENVETSKIDQQRIDDVKQKSESINDQVSEMKDSSKQNHAVKSQTIEFTTLGQYQYELLKNALQKYYKE